METVRGNLASLEESAEALESEYGADDVTYDLYNESPEVTLSFKGFDDFESAHQYMIHVAEDFRELDPDPGVRVTVDTTERYDPHTGESVDDVFGSVTILFSL